MIMYQGAMVEALSIYRKWKGYTLDYEGSQDQLVFCLKEPNSCLARTHAIRISTKARQNKDRDFEIKGYFPDKDCSIVDSRGNTMAQVIIPIHERIYKKLLFVSIEILNVWICLLITMKHR